MVDSLKNELTKSKDFSTLWELAYELFDIDNAQALAYGEEAFKIATSERDTLGIIRAGRITGQILRRMHDLDESVRILQFVLPLAKTKKADKEVKAILNALAIAHSMKAEYDKALQYHFQSLIIREQEGDKRQVSIALNNIGWIYYRLESFDLALKYYLESLTAKKEANDAFDLDRLYINIGFCYSALKEYDNAGNFFNLAFSTCGSACSDQILMEGEHGIANTFFEQNKYLEAAIHLKKSLALAIKTKDLRFEAENLIVLARISLDLKDMAAAGAYVQNLETIPRIQYGEVLLDMYKLKADYYTSIHQFENANHFQQQYSILRDSLYASTVLKNINHVQTQFAQRENMAIIAAKDKVLVLNNEIIDQQIKLNGLLGIVVLLTSVLGLVIYYNYKKIKRVNGALATAKQVIEGQNQFLDHQVQEKTRELITTNKALISVNDELIKVNIEMDNFIYKTSHDIRGPLASLKGMVNLAMLDVRDEKALSYLRKLDVTAEKLNTVLTRLLIVNRINYADLKPEEIHFEPIIQEILSSQMEKLSSTRINIGYEIDPDIHLVSDKELVFLILTNLIDNAIKYYNNSQRIEPFVKIFIRQTNSNVELHVIDNGVGISELSRGQLFQMFVRASERSETGGIGLYLVKLASEKLGGDIKLLSSSNTTEFVVIIPHNLCDTIYKRTEGKKKLDQERLLMRPSFVGRL